MMILKILKFFIFVALLCFFAMVIAELDAGWKNLQYAILIKEALIMSLKYQVVVLPIYFLFFKRD
ncbi:hypothetical protein [Haemophilus haemolyticus]|uniref:hypothetical protein n=1 Tax=Haemophilus haemolyticus TaxID=726 RepID=UPI00062D9E8C|nr:hypothetical protein [Haemophilus haemolyticus]KKZ53893.1 hypothetical protein AAX15_06955 [Haemophilus haemolyticus]